MLQSHDCISSYFEPFALLKVETHLSTDGSSPLKSQAFLSFHMHQHIVIVISMAKETPRFRLMCLVALASLGHVGA
jgi:hypothetical protein